MKFILRTIIIAVAAHFSALYFPWWSVAVCAFLVGAILPGENTGAFFSGFVAIGLLWLFQAFFIHSETDAILSDKIAQLFSLGDGIYMVLITGILGALVGGFSALSGLRFRKMFSRKRNRGVYR